MATSQRLNRGFHRLAIFLAARKREAAKWRGLSSERLLLGISLIGIKPGPPLIVLPPKPVPPPRPRPSRRRADQPHFGGTVTTDYAKSAPSSGVQRPCHWLAMKTCNQCSLHVHSLLPN